MIELRKLAKKAEKAIKANDIKKINAVYAEVLKMGNPWGDEWFIVMLSDSQYSKLETPES